jgi:hypothetical protein
MQSRQNDRCRYTVTFPALAGDHSHVISENDDAQTRVALREPVSGLNVES